MNLPDDMREPTSTEIKRSMERVFTRQGATRAQARTRIASIFKDIEEDDDKEISDDDVASLVDLSAVLKP